ncbi:hypothetical protein GJ496_005770 [Pomphorhynchus laevis]|nr:hypothetical protein GJ496_005770 [Pomphorhynchus laevis]
MNCQGAGQPRLYQIGSVLVFNKATQTARLKDKHLPKPSRSQKRRVFCDSGLRDVLGYNTISSVDLTTAEDVQNGVISTGKGNRNVTVTDESIIHAIRYFPSTSMDGPDGLTFLHLKDLTGPSAKIFDGKYCIISVHSPTPTIREIS